MNTAAPLQKPDFSASLAAQVAQAQDALQQAEIAAQSAQDRHSKLTARLARLQSDLADITARRAEGDESESDAQHATLLHLDATGLQPIVDRAAADLQQVEAAVTDCRNRLSHAEGEWGRHQAQLQAEALEGQLRELETMMVSGIGELARLKRAAAGGGFLAATQCYRLSQPLTRFVQHGVIPS